MTPQERDLIQGVANRLRAANLTEKDAEAERFIQSQIGTQRDALYLLTQSVILQEVGLRQAEERIRQLEAQQSRGGGSGSFLGGSSGGAAVPPPLPPVAAAPPPSSGPSAVGTFLGTAAATAVGVVGGQLIYDGMRHLFSTPASTSGQGWAPGGFLGGLGTPSQGREFPDIGESSRRESERDTDYSPGGGGDWQSDQTDTPDTEEETGGGGDWQSEDASAEDADAGTDDGSGGGDF